MTITFYDILGIDPLVGGRDAIAALRIPSDLVTMTTVNLALTNDRVQIVQLLQQGLTFENLRPGVNAGADVGTGTAGQISFAADVVTGAPLTTQTSIFYLSSLPHTGFQLLPTDASAPAQLFVSTDARGTEVIVDGLPVRILLHTDLVTPIDEAITAADVIAGLPLAADAPDAVGYKLRHAQPSEIHAMVRLHVHPDNEVTIEASVPVSFGEMRYLGLPVKNMYDVQLVASPKHRELYEWTHNDIGAFLGNPPAKGGLAIRSIDLDWSKPPLKDLLDRLQRNGVYTSDIELVLEDVVMPLGVPWRPLPSHGTVGIRRKISDRSDIPNAYDFITDPLRFEIHRSRKTGGSGGTLLELAIEKFFFRSGEIGAADPSDWPQVDVKAAFVFNSPSGNPKAAIIGIDDDWTVILGLEWLPTDTPASFPIAGSTISLVGFTAGYSFGRHAAKFSLVDSIELLADILIESSEHDSAQSKTFSLESATGKPLKQLMRDVGWKLGHFSLESMQFPDGVKLVVHDKVSVVIDEFGWVEEANGTPYFSFSGGVEMHPGSSETAKPNADGKKAEAKGYTISVDRLRFRLNEDSSQPAFKIDGLTLAIKAGETTVDGFGYISDFVDGDWSVKEWGFGAEAKTKIAGSKITLAAEFVTGHRRNAQTGERFNYLLADLEVLFKVTFGPAFELDGIRVLFARNMAPALGAQFPDGEGMALFKWYQQHGNALAVPRNRSLDAWSAESGAMSGGIGFRFSLPKTSELFHFRAFVFVSKSQADTGILVVGEVFLLENKKAIAFVAGEYDFDKQKFGVMAGIDFSLADFISNNAPPPALLQNIATLSGTLYFGNKPCTLAIGQLGDQSSWLSLSIDSVFIKIRFALCVQIVDGGPKGFGFLFEIRYGADRGWGAFLIFGSFGFIAGTFASGSHASGLEFWASFGFRARLFRVFSFGIDIDLKFTYLKNHWSGTAHGELRIHTPRHLPKVTVTIDHTFSDPRPFDMGVLRQLLSNAAGIDPATHAAQPLLLPGLGNALGDASFVYSFNQLNGLNGLRIADTHAQDVPILSIDATIAIRFCQPVSNDALVGENTYDGTSDDGVQRVQDITVRYGLQSIAIRRAPRFGPNAGVWSDVLTNAQSAFSIGGVAPQTITFCWDHDARGDGKVTPVALLMNSAAPYSFATSSPQSDEESVRNDPSFPCCDTTWLNRALPAQHVVDFRHIASGARAPRSKKFSGDRGAWWRWTLAPLPAIGFGAAGAYAIVSLQDIVAEPLPPVINPHPWAGTRAVLGYADLEEPASEATITLGWGIYPAIVYFEGYRGLDLAAQQSADLRDPRTDTLTISVGPTETSGFTRLVLRAEFAQFASTGPPMPLSGIIYVLTHQWPPDTSASRIDVFRITYTAIADSLRHAAMVQRCGNGGNVGPPRSDGHGKLAFLPNHDYEVVVTGTASVGTRAQGTRTATLSEALYFRTKGLPGLNACANTGDDIRLHVDTTYAPRRDVPLYRAEPCALAFENSLSSVLPIDRVPAAGDPPERAQMFELALNVDRVVSMDGGLKRLTVPSNDWISQHSALPPAPSFVVATPGIANAAVRVNRASDPQVLRFEALKAQRAACGPQNVDHASQVLLHEPIDGAGTAGLWEAATGYRATVRQKNGPYAERSSFDAYDLATFVMQADGGANAAAWSVDGSGNLVAPAAGAGRSYAAIGEPGWDHLQVHARIDLRTATAAGIAVGAGSGTPVAQAVLATIEATGGGNHALVLRQRIANVEQELARAVVTVTGPAMLSVIAFDDVVRATVGDVSAEGVRGVVREGRVALVAAGPAAFAGIAVDGLDISTFEFLSSKYASFDEHLASYDGTLPVLASGAFGGTPATGASVLAAHGAQIAPVMQRSADPQARQRLFDAVVTSLGIGLQKHPTSVGIARLADAGGTFGLLVESPEPLALTRDVTFMLTKQAGTSGVAVPLTALSNGAETSVLLISLNGTPLGAGSYVLRGTIDRDRWAATGPPQPERHYHDAHDIALQW